MGVDLRRAPPWAAALVLCAGYVCGCGGRSSLFVPGGEALEGRDGGPDASVDLGADAGDGGREADATETGAVDADAGSAVDAPAMTTPDACDPDAGTQWTVQRFNGDLGGEARLVVADFDGDGRLDLAVAEQFGSDLVVKLGNGDGSFREASRYALGELPYRIATGDLDGDGKLDLLLAMSGLYDQDSGGVVSSSVGVLLGKGDGTFSSVTRYPIAASGEAGSNMQTIGVAIADLDGDGKADLATVTTSGDLYVLRGKGHGALSNSAWFDSGVTSAYSLAAGDVDLDGMPDLIVGGYRPSDAGGTGVVSVLLTRNGKPSNPASYPCGGGEASDAVVVDLDGDGKPDLAVSDFSGPGVGVLRGIGDGTFKPVVTYQVPTSAYSIRVADMDRDGRKDLVVATGYGLVILLQTAGGSFQPLNLEKAAYWDVTYGTYGFTGGLGVLSVDLGDFDGDRVPDVAMGVMNYGVQILHNPGDAHVRPIEPIHHAGPLDLATGDLDGDGRMDLFVANIGSSTVGVLLGSGDGTFRTEVDYGPGDGGPFPVESPTYVTPGDFNADGTLDLLVAEGDNGYGRMVVYLGQDGGALRRLAAGALNGPYGKAVVADFDGDGILDFAVRGMLPDDAGRANQGVLIVASGHGDGTFTMHEAGYIGFGPFAGGDLNGDGKEDLVSSPVGVAYGSPCVVTVRLGRGDGTFATAVGYPLDSNDAGSSASQGIAVGDVNGDGKQDVVVLDQVAGEVLVFSGTGDGTLEGPVRIGVAPTPSNSFGPPRVALGDMNGDGHVDLAVLRSVPRGDQNQVMLLLGHGDMTFEPAITRAVDYEPMAVVAGDFTGRSRSDVVVCNYGTNDMSYLGSAPSCAEGPQGGIADGGGG